MGTTVTTNLGLIKPDLAEKIKEDLPSFPGWATQNGLNMDKVDSLFRASTGTWTVTLTASVSNPVLGVGGFTEGKYVRLFPRLVIAYFRIFTGTSAFTVGSGEYMINLPFAMDPVLVASDGGGRTTPFGKAVFRDNDAVTGSSAHTVLYTPLNDRMCFGLSQGNTLLSSHPVAVNDRLSGYFIYPTAAA